MSAIEVARRTRDVILAGNKVDIHVEPPADSVEYAAGYLGPDDWPKVLGAFAAIYTPTDLTRIHAIRQTTPDQPEFDGFNGNYGHFWTKRVKDAIIAELDESIPEQDIGGVVNFSNTEDLLEWTEREAGGFVIDLMRDTLPDEASSAMTGYLTNRGINTFTGRSMGLAVLLTELLAANPYISHEPGYIRSVIVKQGRKLLLPLMFNQDNFLNLGDGLTEDFAADPREYVLTEARKRFTSEVRAGDITHIRWKLPTVKQDGSAGCPFALAKNGALIKPAWGMVLDYMWEPLLKRRLTEPLPKT